MAGAIDSDGSDKAARFLQLCDAYDIPILFLCDTPGMMVGPEIEKIVIDDREAHQFAADGSQAVEHRLHHFDDAAGVGIAAHRAGKARGDDETLVVAQWAPPHAASTEPARETSK